MWNKKKWKTIKLRGKQIFTAFHGFFVDEPFVTFSFYGHKNTKHDENIRFSMIPSEAKIICLSCYFIFFAETCPFYFPIDSTTKIKKKRQKVSCPVFSIINYITNESLVHHHFSALHWILLHDEKKKLIFRFHVVWWWVHHYQHKNSTQQWSRNFLKKWYDIETSLFHCQKKENDIFFRVIIFIGT